MKQAFAYRPWKGLAVWVGAMALDLIFTRNGILSLMGFATALAWSIYLTPKARLKPVPVDSAVIMALVEFAARKAPEWKVPVSDIVNGITPLMEAHGLMVQTRARAECVQIVLDEPNLPGSMPAEFEAKVKEVGLEVATRAMLAAQQKSIAGRILTYDSKTEPPGLVWEDAPDGTSHAKFICPVCREMIVEATERAVFPDGVRTHPACAEKRTA